MKTKNTIEKINEAKSCIFFQKINNIVKLLDRLIKENDWDVQINKIRIEKREVTTNTTEVQRIIGNC